MVHLLIGISNVYFRKFESKLSFKINIMFDIIVEKLTVGLKHESKLSFEINIMFDIIVKKLTVDL